MNTKFIDKVNDFCYHFTANTFKRGLFYEKSR